MIPFKQTIREGQSGRDVLAVKLGMRAMHVAGSGGMIVRGSHRRFAGHSFATCIRTVQRNHSLHQDGIYGRRTHEIVAPHFGAYAHWLYRTAARRKPPVPPVPATAQAAAKKLLQLHAQGKYRDDRGGSELAQIEATAAGRAVWSPRGYYVHLDARILQTLCWLIEDKGFKIGTFAMCSDHGPDSPMGHSGGHCVDISSIDNVSVTASVSQSRPKVIAVLKAIHGAPAHLRAWQLISGGCANMLQSECEALCLPSAGFYGGATLLQHTNHIHLGYL